MQQGQFVLMSFGRFTTDSFIQRITKASLHVDQTRLKKIRRIQRSKTATQNADEDSDEDDQLGNGRNASKSIFVDDAMGDDDFDTLIDDEGVSSTTKVEPQSSRPPPSSRATQVVDMEDDGDDESEEEGEEDETIDED
jgi:hypothetical protein